MNSIKSRTQHEWLRRRRFFAAATAIIGDTDAKIIYSGAYLEGGRTAPPPKLGKH